MDAKSTIHFMEMLQNSTEASIQKKNNTNMESIYDVLAYLVLSFWTSMTCQTASQTSKQVY